MTEPARGGSVGGRAYFAAEPADTSWMVAAACSGASPVAFFVGRGENLEANAVALAFCARCDVRAECLEYAIAHGVNLPGIWGGETQAGRRRIIRARKKGAR